MNMHSFQNLQNRLKIYLLKLFIKRNRPIWCCCQFEFYYKKYGKRGISIFTKYFNDKKGFFFIQYRSIDPDTAKKQLRFLVNNELISENFLFSIISETGISYCPWCGKKLTKYYLHQIDKLISELDINQIKLQEEEYQQSLNIYK